MLARAVLELDDQVEEWSASSPRRQWLESVSILSAKALEVAVACRLDLERMISLEFVPGELCVRKSLTDSRPPEVI